MGLETATYINGLVSTNPIPGDSASQGDDHIRLLKAVLLATFPNLTGAVTKTQAQINDLVTATSIAAAVTTLLLTATSLTATSLTATEITETVYNLTGTAIDPANGTIQYKALSGNTTFTSAIDAGQSVTLMIDDGSAYTGTWPTMTWVGGAAPPLTTTGYTVVVLWKVGTTLYGSLVGYA